MRKIAILIILIIIILILIIGWLAWKGYQISEKKSLLVLTDQKEYPVGENPKIKIKNNLDKTVCFSSCYPYYLEKKDGSLKSYPYGSCPKADIAEICMRPKETKAFELMLNEMKLEKGIHRIAIPACISCALQSSFKKDKFFYSNEFIIK